MFSIILIGYFLRSLRYYIKFYLPCLKYKDSDAYNNSNLYLSFPALHKQTPPDSF